MTKLEIILIIMFATTWALIILDGVEQRRHARDFKIIGERRNYLTHRIYREIAADCEYRKLNQRELLAPKAPLKTVAEHLSENQDSLQTSNA